MVTENGVVSKQRQEVDKLVQSFVKANLDLLPLYDVMLKEYKRQMVHY